MERFPEPEQTPSHAAEQEPLVISIRRGMDRLDPEKDFPYQNALRLIGRLGEGDPEETNRLFRKVGLSDVEAHAFAEVARAETHQLFRGLGLTDEQIGALKESAQLDIREHREGRDSHKFRMLTGMYREERGRLEALVKDPRVAAQVRACADAVVAYDLDHALVEQPTRSFDVRLFGPIAALLDTAEEFGTALSVASLAVGGFHPARRTVSVRVNEQSLAEGTLQDHDRNTLIHEMVHSTSPTGVRVRMQPDGTAVYTRLRSGFASQASRSTRRSEEYALVSLNEGVTETVAREIGRRLGIEPDREPVYEEYIQDVRTLVNLLGIDPDELYRLYHDPAGTLKLGRMLRERTALGPHALALFDIFARAGGSGFTGFLESFEAARHNDPRFVPKQITVPRFLVETETADGKRHAVYPPLTADMLQASFPFIRFVP